MISTAEMVGRLVKSSPFLEEGLSRKIISYSALARDIQPELQEKLFKPVKRGAIVMSLKRVSDQMKQKKFATNGLGKLGNITVRSNLREFTYMHSETLGKREMELLLAIEKRSDIFCNLSQGVRETTLIISQEIEKDVEKIFQQEKLLLKLSELSSISIRLSEDTVHTPGVYYALLKSLAWEGVNVVEVFSTYMDITLVFRNNEIEKAFTILKKLVSN